MTIDIFTLCDSAQDYNGKMVIVGTFSTIVLDSFPIKYPEFAIAVRLGFEKEEVGEHTVEISIKKVNEELNLINNLQAKMTADKTINQSFYSNFIVKMNNILLPSAGEYVVTLKVDDVEKKTKLIVLQKQSDKK